MDRLHKAGAHLHAHVVRTGLTLGTGRRRSGGMWLLGREGILSPFPSDGEIDPQRVRDWPRVM